MKHSVYRHDARLITALLSPLERVEAAPTWAKIVASIGAVCQYIVTDAFTGAVVLVLLVGVSDYLVGVRAARMAGVYTPAAAHRGAMGKIAGLLIVFILRLLEQYMLGQGLVNTRGMLATAVALSLFAVDLQSIAHHRESFGAKPIPVLSTVLAWIHRIASSKVPSGDDEHPHRRATDP